MHVLYGLTSFPLTRFWELDDPIVLVPAMKAYDLCREEGYEELPVREALWLFDTRDLMCSRDIRQFVSHANLTSLYLPDTKDHQLVEIVRRAIEKHRLIALHKGKPANQAPDETAQQRQLVRQIEQQTRGHMNFAGRQYTLVADVDLKRMPGRDSYEVVSHDDARRVLDGLAVGAATDLAPLLGKAREKLTPDWPSNGQPDGLILLRRSIVLAAPRRNDEPAITPSQMKALMEKATLEIHVVDLNQKPQEGLAFEIKMPDGGSVSGKLDKDGRGRAKSSALGFFTVSFPDLDGADWNGDGAQKQDEKARSEASRYKVEQGDRLPTIARKKGFARWQTIWDFDGNVDLKDLRGNAHILFPDDEVSIPSKLARVAEVSGGKAEYVVQSAVEVLRVRFAGVWSSENEPVTFKATPDTVDDPIEGKLLDDCIMTIDLPSNTRRVRVQLFRLAEKEPIASYNLDVGNLDPTEEISGIQGRLRNLGYYDGVITGKMDEKTQNALIQFRLARLGDSKDFVDAKFLQALREAHGT
jgi:N-acetylmuramoyl-L-alanine amidase